MWDYTNKVRDHYLNPRNVGEIENPDGLGEVGNISCGDALKLTFKLDKDKKITDIKFKTFGCGSAIASASILTELCKGKSLSEAKKIKNKDIAEALDGLPKEKLHCSVMGEEALEAAIRYYESGGKVSIPAEKEGRVVCHCFNVTEIEIKKAIMENSAKTLDDIMNLTKAGGACQNCRSEIQAIIDQLTNLSQKAAQPRSTQLSTIDKIDRIRKVLSTEVRAILAKDGGDCELIDIEGNNVYISLIGHCRECVFSNNTLYSVVERILKEKVSDQIVVKPA